MNRLRCLSSMHCLKTARVFADGPAPVDAASGGRSPGGSAAGGRGVVRWALDAAGLRVAAGEAGTWRRATGRGCARRCSPR